MNHEHFDSIDSLLTRLRNDVPDNPFHDERATHAYIWVKQGGVGRIVPSFANSFWSTFLYRGQVKRHTPCVPAVFRALELVDHPQKLSRRERARCFLDRVRLEEFLLALAQHPACEYSREIGLAMSAEAVAQHYGMTTDRLDLTQDPLVAAFFATNMRRADGTWRTVSSDKSGEMGVVYRINIHHFQSSLRDSSDLEWIGKQALPRPGEQKAWALRVPLGSDFEKLPLDVFTFAHDKSCGGRINERFGEGKLLFPSDVLAEIAMAIREACSVPRDLVTMVLTWTGCPTACLERELHASTRYFQQHFGIAVVDRKPIAFSRAQYAAASMSLEHQRCTFLDDVGVRAVRSR